MKKLALLLAVLGTFGLMAPVQAQDGWLENEIEFGEEEGPYADDYEYEYDYYGGFGYEDQTWRDRRGYTADYYENVQDYNEGFEFSWESDDEWFDSWYEF